MATPSTTELSPLIVHSTHSTIPMTSDAVSHMLDPNEVVKKLIAENITAKQTQLAKFGDQDSWSSLSRAVQIQAALLVYPLPEHWKTPAFVKQVDSELGRVQRIRAYVRWAVFTKLCLAAHGLLGMEEIWATMMITKELGQDAMWADLISGLSTRLNSVILMGSIMFAGLAAFLTTEPPRPEIFNYKERLPYTCMAVASALCISGVASGATTVLLISTMKYDWVLDKAKRGNSFSLYTTLLVTCHPTVSIIAAVFCMLFGLFVSGVNADDIFYQSLSIAMFATMTGLLVLCLFALYR